MEYRLSNQPTFARLMQLNPPTPLQLYRDGDITNKGAGVLGLALLTFAAMKWAVPLAFAGAASLALPVTALVTAGYIGGLYIQRITQKYYQIKELSNWLSLDLPEANKKVTITMLQRLYPQAGFQSQKDGNAKWEKYIQKETCY